MKNLKLNPSNFSGTIQATYSVLVNPIRDTPFVTIELWVKLPDGKLRHYDSVTAIEGDTFSENMNHVCIMAEDRWGIALARLEIDNKQPL